MNGHPYASVSHPPTRGPIAGAKVAVMLNRAIPIGCFDGGRKVRITVKESGIRTPPVNPCKIRKMIISSSDRAWPQQTEKIRNRMELTKRYRLSEKACASQAVKGITTISATK